MVGIINRLTICMGVNMKTGKVIKIRKKLNTFDIVILVLLFALMIITLYPMWYVVCASFSNSVDIAKNPGIMLWPERLTFGAYKLVFQHPLLLSGFKNTLVILVCALPLNILMTLLCGYFMAAGKILFKKPIIAFILFTMFFSGGLIPSYLNQKSLGLYNNLAALIVPTALSVYNAIICKTAIEAIPESLTESAYMDGANDFTVMFRIITPLIKPTLAVLLLYYGVGHWNGWFNASIYIKDNALLPIQNIIRAVLLQNTSLSGEIAGDNFNSYAETIKYAAIVVSTVPILCIYPFLQKYFTKGVMIGAVKG